MKGVIEHVNLIAMLLICLIALTVTLFYTTYRIKVLRHQLFTERELDEVSHARAIADGFYDNVLEADLTHDMLIGKNCRKLAGQLGLSPDTSFSSCIEAIVKKMVKEKYRALYRENFDRDKLLERYARGELKFSFTFEEKTDTVHYCWTRVTVCLYYSETSHTVKLVSYVKNIQEEKEREFRLSKEASTDYLTGLFNKRAIEQSIRDILMQDDQVPRRHALLIVDIDYFKQVNDTIGHMGGDKVLCAIARLLKGQSGEKDLVGRIGGDEFLIFMRDCESAQSVENRMKTLVDAAASPDMEALLGIAVSLSIGGACARREDDFHDLFARADEALYHVKTHGRNGGCLSEGSRNQIK